MAIHSTTTRSDLFLASNRGEKSSACIENHFWLKELSFHLFPTLTVHPRNILGGTTVATRERAKRTERKKPLKCASCRFPLPANRKRRKEAKKKDNSWDFLCLPFFRLSCESPIYKRLAKQEERKSFLYKLFYASFLSFFFVTNIMKKHFHYRFAVAHRKSSRWWWNALRGTHTAKGKSAHSEKALKFSPSSILSLSLLPHT